MEETIEDTYLKILHIASGDFFSTYGGGQVYVKNVVDAMIDCGIDVAVISTVASAKSLRERDYRGKIIYEIPHGLSSSDLSALISQIAPDVIHAHSLKDIACKIGGELNIPVVVTAHHGGIVCPGGARMNCKDEICEDFINHKNCLPCVLSNIRTGLKWWYPFMRHLSQKRYVQLGHFLKNKRFIPFITPIGTAALCIQNHSLMWKTISTLASKIIAPSHRIGEVMRRNGLLADKIAVIPHGIPLPINECKYPSTENTPIKFYYVGRICYAKGVHIMLEAFRSLRGLDIELHLIGGAGNKGEARYMNALQQQTEDDKRIIWHGKVSLQDIFKETSNYHVMIAPTIMLEIFGLNIAEALAMGKPVIASASGGGEMQIRDGENGWVVECNNSEALAEKIREIVANPSILQAMSACCHAISIQQHCNELIKLYKEVI